MLNNRHNQRKKITLTSKVTGGENVVMRPPQNIKPNVSKDVPEHDENTENVLGDENKNSSDIKPEDSQKHHYSRREGKPPKYLN